MSTDQGAGSITADGRRHRSTVETQLKAGRREGKLEVDGMSCIIYREQVKDPKFHGPSRRGAVDLGN